MASLKANYDRVLVAIAGLLALVIGALLTMKALALPDKYRADSSTQKAELGDTGQEAIDNAKQHLAKKSEWLPADMPGVPQKKIPLMQSVPVWIKGEGEDAIEIDLLDPKSPPIRPPMSNLWVYEHRLDIGRSDINTLDGDNDGFPNEEEFLSGKTNPNDASSHPPFTNKLRLVEVKVDQYKLTFRTGDNPASEFGIREETELFEADPPRKAPRRATHYAKIGADSATFGKHPESVDRWKLVDFAKRMKPGGPGGTLLPAHILTVEDSKNGNAAVRLVYREPFMETSSYAVFEYSLPGHKGLLGPYKKGDKFSLPNDPGTEFQLLEVTPEAAKGARIQKLGETPQDITIPFGEASAAGATTEHSAETGADGGETGISTPPAPAAGATAPAVPPAAGAGAISPAPEGAVPEAVPTAP